MKLTKKQQCIKDRREYIFNAYVNKPTDVATTSLVESLSKKFGITIVQVYNDIKSMKTNT